MSAKRTKLDQFPCPRWSPYQRHGCEPGPACRVYEDHCEYEEVYRKAVADHKCARLLGIFERWFAGTTDWAISAIPDEEPWRDTQFERFRRYIRDALRAAGRE